MSHISRDEIKALLDAGHSITLVETLGPQHFEQGHLPGAIHIGMDEVTERAAESLPDRDALIVTYCSNTACQNSAAVAAKLTKLGYRNVRRYEEGKQDWTEAGLPLEVPVA
jgi:rhodanese-related sulfurtransferase